MEPLTLAWKDGLQARIDPFGAALLSLRAPGPDEYIDLILPSTSTRRFDSAYMGRMIGRYANRLANSTFSVAGQRYRVDPNDGPNHLHGGSAGLHSRDWTVLSVEETGARRIVLRYISPDGEGGYPGTLAVTATYELTPDALSVTVDATTDRPTPVSFTVHPYFNLTGDPSSNVEDHQVAINADRFLPIDPSGIPEGAPRQVAGTPFDLRQRTRIGDRLLAPDPQIRSARGFDHAFILDGTQPAAELSCPRGRMSMQLFTNQPALQFYTGQWLNQPWRAYRGLCLEPEQFPDAPNRPDFPCTLLEAGGVFHFEVAYRFGSR
ncbi:aldose epimerase family protein [Peristeroidobacter soli]|uniref:aldose epimerase family protein n=1 Tax=Peristeroidobacter soli TaxID=2497877 RepID=UPI00101C0E9F|nr:aldose epimerase family protein [Peristeroidobacter soli]